MAVESGEKLLRNALIRTPEYKSADVSLIRDSKLASIVANRDSTRLRKSHFLTLCWVWRYASPFWRKKRTKLSAPRGRRAPAASAEAGTEATRTSSGGGSDDAAGALALLPSPSDSRALCEPLESFRLLLWETLSSFASVDAALQLANAAAQGEARAPVMLQAQIMLTVIDIGRLRAQRMTADAERLANLSNLSLSLGCEAGAACDAPCAHCPEADVADEHIAVVRHLLVATEAGMAQVPPGYECTLGAVDRAYLHDVRLGMLPLSQLVCRIQAEFDSQRRAMLPRHLLLSAGLTIEGKGERHVFQDGECWYKIKVLENIAEGLSPNFCQFALGQAF